MTGDENITKAHGYKSYRRNSEEYLKQSLHRLALFADTKRIKSPKECREALATIPANLFYTEQYTVLEAYANG